MLTDHRLAEALSQVRRLEQDAEAAMQTEDQAERDSAVLVLRLARPLGAKLETWISLRALRRELSRHQRPAVTRTA